MSIVIFSLVTLGASAGAWWLTKRLQSEEAAIEFASSSGITMELPVVVVPPAKAHKLLRSANPAATAGTENLVWELKGEGNCMLSQSLGHKRLSSRDAVPLAAAACKRVDCRCYYQAVPEQRRGLRRLMQDRRELFRLPGSASSGRQERRKDQDRRRSAQQWADRKHW